MANMSYCRFENTESDLSDCVENWDENDDLSSSEKRAKESIIELAKEILEMQGYEVNEIN